MNMNWRALTQKVVGNLEKEKKRQVGGKTNKTKQAWCNSTLLKSPAGSEQGKMGSRKCGSCLSSLLIPLALWSIIVNILLYFPNGQASYASSNKLTNYVWYFEGICFSGIMVSANSLRAHGLQHTKFPYTSPTPEAYLNSSPLHWWCTGHPAISFSVIPSFSHLQSFPASGSFSNELVLHIR